jgi:hypothetical protein
MTPFDAYWLWYDFSQIVGGVVGHRQHYVDSDDEYINWERQRHAIHIAGLAFACSLLESIEKKYTDPHNTVLFKIRNALMHNDSDLSSNNDHPISLNQCTAYLTNSTWAELNPLSGGDVRQPFQISDSGIVSFSNNSDLFFFIERVFDTYMTSSERSRSRPRSNP